MWSRPILFRAISFIIYCGDKLDFLSNYCMQPNVRYTIEVYPNPLIPHYITHCALFLKYWPVIG